MFFPDCDPKKDYNPEVFVWDFDHFWVEVPCSGTWAPSQFGAEKAWHLCALKVLLMSQMTPCAFQWSGKLNTQADV